MRSCPMAYVVPTVNNSHCCGVTSSNSSMDGRTARSLADVDVEAKDDREVFPGWVVIDSLGEITPGLEPVEGSEILRLRQRTCACILICPMLSSWRAIHAP